MRHADARCLVISTQNDQQRFQITIADDGKGFDVDEARQRSGLGLRNMEQRARLHGGHINIKTAPGEGTTLTVTIPIVSR